MKGHTEGMPGGGDYRARYRELVEQGFLPGLSLVGTEGLRLPLDEGGADELRTDPLLAAPLLKVFGGRERLSRAELELLRAGAFAFGLFSSNRVGRCEDFPYDSFWSMSLLRAVAAQDLSRELERTDHVEAFVVAFLRRIGALALAEAFPTEYACLLRTLAAGSAEEQSRLERERFGIDHVHLSHALLADLGFPRVGLERLEQLLEPGEAELHGIFDVVEQLAMICSLDEGRRGEHWERLSEVRRELGLERDSFSGLGDATVRCWWDWGELLGIATRPITSFYALDQTGAYQRHLLQIAEPPDAPRQRMPRVLVVDDDPTARKVIEAQLCKGGYAVVTAADGREALERMQRHMPEIVVADWVMPHMDGLELCRALRRFEAGRNVFFVMLTGRDEETHMLEAFEAGVDDFLMKPSKAVFLLARMIAARRVLDLRERERIQTRINRHNLASMNRFARQLKDRSSTDVLTGLPNRRYALSRMQEEWAAASRSGKPLSVVMLDVDHFKRINDTFGHEVGDEVLRSVAEVLEHSSRRGEVACRFGGEEFLIICRETDEEQAHSCAERIREAIAEGAHFDSPGAWPVTVSVGVATRDDRMESPEDLVRSADAGVYLAKDGGRNRTVVSGFVPRPASEEWGDPDPGEGRISEKDSPPGSRRSEGDEAA